MESQHYYFGGAFVLLLLIIFIILFFLSKRKIRKEQERIAYENQVVPHMYGKDKIFLRRNEIQGFEDLTRKEQRRVVTRMKSDIKTGKYRTIYLKGEIVGYERA